MILDSFPREGLMARKNFATCVECKCTLDRRKLGRRVMGERHVQGTKIGQGRLERVEVGRACTDAVKCAKQKEIRARLTSRLAAVLEY